MKKVYPFLVLTLVPLLTMCSGPYGPMMGGWNGTENYGCPFYYGHGGVFMGIIFLIILVVAIYFIAQSIITKKGIGQATESPMDILKRRYAKGEITKEDFDRMKNELQ
jgi:putative membrane protein